MFNFLTLSVGTERVDEKNSLATCLASVFPQLPEKSSEKKTPEHIAQNVRHLAHDSAKGSF